MADIKKIKSKDYSREFSLDIRKSDAVDKENRTIEVAFSSDAEVERWFGLEILDHSAGAVDLSRLENSGAVLMDHNHTDQVGVIERAWIDKDRKGRALLRFGRSARASEIFDDVQDGIRSLISFGYRVRDIVLEESRDGVDVYRATRWEPYEISLVSIPADSSVGVGRSGKIFNEGVKMKKKNNQDDDQNANNRNDSIVAVAADNFDRDAELKTMQKEERSRIADINKMATEFGVRDLADEHIDKGLSVDDMRQAVLSHLGKQSGRKDGETVASVGMSDADLRSYSVARAVAAVAFPSDSRVQKLAAFELEASRAAADASGFDAQGVMIPGDIMQRGLNVAGAAQGGDLVANDLQSTSMIELLRNKLIFSGLNPRILSGLEGDITVPGQSGSATGYWIDEGEDVAESQQSIRQVALKPKTYGAFTEYTRRLLLQSSIDVERFIIDDLIAVLALGIDKAAMYGTGLAGQPLGITNQAGIGAVQLAAAGKPTFEELVALESAIASANADVASMAYAMRPTMRGHCKTTEKFESTGATLWESGNQVNGYSTAISNQVNVGDIIFGNFSDLMIGLWGGLDLVIDPFTKATNGGTRIVAMQSVDTAVRNPVSFALGRG